MVGVRNNYVSMLVNHNLPVALVEKLNVFAKERGIPRVKVVIEALEAYLDGREQEAAEV